MNKKLVLNYIYNLAYQILMVIVPLISTPYISRVLLPEGVGIYSYTQTIATAFTLFAALGVNNYGQREIAYYQKNRKERSIIFWELFWGRFITTIVVCAVYIVFSFLYTDYSKYLMGHFFVVAGTVLDISWLYGGMEDFKTVALRNVFVRIITLALIFVLVKSSDDVLIYILINSLTTLTSYALFFLHINKYIDYVHFSDLNIRRHVNGTLGFFLPLISIQLYSQLDKIMLGVMVSSKLESGYYEQARKIVNIVILVLTSINSVMYPRIANLYKENNIETIKYYYRATFRIIVLLMLPIVTGLFIVSPVFTTVFFGNGYEGVSVLIRLSCLLLVFMTIGNFVGVQYLSPTGKQNEMTKIYMLSAIVNLSLNCVLIAKYLAVGAMIASIIAEGVSCIMQLALYRKSNYYINLFSNTSKYSISTVCMALIVSRIINIHITNDLLLLAITSICGCGSYFLILVILNDEMILKVITTISKKIKGDQL